MLEAFPDSILRLIDRFSKFPGIGKKTAQRMAFHVLKDSKEIYNFKDYYMIWDFST